VNQHSRFALTFIALLLAGCMPSGQRLLHVRVEHEGQLVAEGIYSVTDTLDQQATWERLNEASLEPVAQLTPQPDNSGRVVLTGKIRLVLVHANRPYAVAETTQLRLDADPAKPGYWQLTPAEVARTGKSLK
jgi:hypothetical protein